MQPRLCADEELLVDDLLDKEDGDGHGEGGTAPRASRSSSDLDTTYR